MILSAVIVPPTYLKLTPVGLNFAAYLKNSKNPIVLLAGNPELL